MEKILAVSVVFILCVTDSGHGYYCRDTNVFVFNRNGHQVEREVDGQVDGERHIRATTSATKL